MRTSETIPNAIAEKRARFETLAKAHEALLFRIALKFARSEHSRASDYVQDTLVNAYQAFLNGSFDENSNAKAWLTKILTNVFLNENRRRSRWESGSEVDPELSDGPRSLADHALLTATLDGPIEAALLSLPEHQRLCVILVDLEEMDYNEAATILDVPVGTVRSRLARARMALHEKLVEYGKSKGY